MHILLNAVAATAGGGLTYLRNVVPHLAASPNVKLTVLVPPGFSALKDNANVKVLEFRSTGGSAVRFWQEQKEIPQLARRIRADILISAGNFAIRDSPVPQILLSRNSLYTSRDFERDLLRRGHYAIWLDTKIKGVLAKRSIHWADLTVAPTEAFAQELRAWTGCAVTAIHHGFDEEQFIARAKPLSPEIQAELSAAQDCFCLLSVSHYNYYRNFETLLRALAMLKQQAPESKFRLFLTCKFSSSENPGLYRAERAAALVNSLGIRQEVVELGAVPYDQLHQLYRCCNVYVTAAYAESFAHPLVEAMASGLPIVASDIAVHREICDRAAVFFDHFSPEELARQIMKLTRSREECQELSRRARTRSLDFSWAKHAQELLKLANSLMFDRSFRPS